MKKAPSNEQIQEWLESPVADYLRGLIEKYIDDFEIGLDLYHPYEPEKTQESMAGMTGARGSWLDILDVLEGDFTLVEEIDERSEVESEEP